MRINANAPSYIMYIGPVLGAFNVAKQLNKMHHKLMLGVPGRDGLWGPRPRRMPATATLCTRQLCTALECLVYHAGQWSLL
jgi:hypothetical protein